MDMSQRPNIELSGILHQRTGVPADHIDPNHPYFPHDDEAQLPPRPFYARHSLFTKKRFIIPTCTTLIVALLIAALLGGIKIGLSSPHNARSNDYNNNGTYDAYEDGPVRGAGSTDAGEACGKYLQ
ncbi:uncharacterized protein J4E84_010087 [Alternaria hordeiaustralica]|uniref:uncharacterized protein n=1 Tax=Alternaria hordeiaustralica TaxID=1187925 RepID=UPI0020C22679|nr:uncharacterized protein J4E84_010087 [Alternaria hordeiaustralica]KAI4675345.1 hypothetical protein J4E84_010087 [Alternaria hordeiaustralica]